VPPELTFVPPEPVAFEPPELVTPPEPTVPPELTDPPEPVVPPEPVAFDPPELDEVPPDPTEPPDPDCGDPPEPPESGAGEQPMALESNRARQSDAGLAARSLEQRWFGIVNPPRGWGRWCPDARLGGYGRASVIHQPAGPKITTPRRAPMAHYTPVFPRTFI
jgi:hypothetical protein